MFDNLIKSVKPMIDEYVKLATQLRDELKETNKLLRELNTNIKDLLKERKDPILRP